ncbi:MAG: hypothetical protein MJ082_01155 [Clostridia bacterium]|nr:hypothetical protein [Clostridia bacterium]
MAEQFTVSLGGCTIDVSCVYPTTRAFLKDYLSTCAPDFSVTVTDADIAAEAEKSRLEDEAEGIPVRSFPETYLETLALYRKIAEKLPAYGTFLIHGSAIAVDNEAFLFCAKSGTGKSTHTRLWRKKFGDRAYMVNDDKPLLRVTENGAVIYGTPWDGKHRLSRPVAVGLRAVCILNRGAENRIERLTGAERFPNLFRQIYRPEDPAALAQTLGLINGLLKVCPIYNLRCNMDPEAADVAYSGMTANETPEKES